MSSQRPDGLIFDWPTRHNLHLVLPLMLVAAVVVHAAFFFVFSIMYPIPTSEGVNPATVYVPMRGSAQAAQLATLLPLADPMIVTPGQGPMSSPEFPAAHYRAVYETSDAALAPLPVDSEPEVAQMSRLGPVVLPVARPARTATVAPRTTLHAGGELAARVPELPPRALFFSAGRQSPEPARFTVAVRADGSVAHVFLQTSSGDSELDASAARTLSLLKFQPGDPALTWGDVTLSWGADVRAKGAE